MIPGIVGCALVGFFIWWMFGDLEVHTPIPEETDECAKCLDTLYVDGKRCDCSCFYER